MVFPSFLQSVEQFQSRLEEAEKAAIQKQHDCRPGWQKHRYSDYEYNARKREEKEEQKERSVENLTHREQPKERYYKDYTQEQRRDRPANDKEPRYSNKDTSTKDISSRIARNFQPMRNYEKPFASPLKPVFLRPSDEGEQENRPQSSQSRLHTPALVSCGFRKPGDDAGVIPRWRKMQPVKEDDQATQEEKQFKNHEPAVTSGEKDPREKLEEISEDALRKKEPLDQSSDLRYLRVHVR